MSDNDEEFVRFVETAGGSLQRLAYLVCGDWHLADDVVQDTLYKLYLGWHRVDRKGNPLGYARRAVVNAAIDASRRPWRREVPAEPGDDESGTDPTAEVGARDEMLRVLGSLPPRQRACVVLRYYEDLSIEQTADLLGCSTGTVKSNAARGLEALRHVLAAQRSASAASTAGAASTEATKR